MAKNKLNTVGSDFSDHLTENLREPSAAAAYLMISLEDEDVNYFKQALGNVARAYGIGKVAKISDVPRTTLYNILQKESNPGLNTIFEVLKACGLTIAVVPKKKSELTEIIGSGTLSRADIIKKLWAYIRKNDLTEDLLDVGQKELNQLAKATHKLGRHAKSLTRGTKKRA